MRKREIVILFEYFNVHTQRNTESHFIYLAKKPMPKLNNNVQRYVVCCIFCKTCDRSFILCVCARKEQYGIALILAIEAYSKYDSTTKR